MKKLLSILTAAIIALSMLSACSSQKENQTNTTTAMPSAPGTPSAPSATTSIAPQKTMVSIALSENMFNLDPLNSNSLPDRISTFNVFEPLVDFNHKGISGEFTGLLASTWEVDDKKCTWTFHLRKGIKFHNGEDFTSADVVTTYKRLIDDKASSCSNQFWPLLKSVEAVDDYTVKITTSEPFASTLISVAYTPIIPDEAYKKLGKELWKAGGMYGTGPWKFVEWVDGAYTSYVKNEEYWNKKVYNPKFTQMSIKYILESSSAISAQLAGAVDAYVPANGINVDLLKQYDAYKNKIDLVTMDTGTFNYFGFNCAKGVFTDVNARMAFEYAIDRQAICDTIYSGAAKVPNSAILDSVPGYNKNLAPYKYDPKVAKEYLAKSNYDGHKIVLYSSSGLSKSEETLLAVSEMLNAVGFKTSVSIVEGATFTNLRKNGEYEVFLINDMTVGGDLAKYLSQKIIGDSHKHGLKNAELMDLSNKILTELDPVKRADLYSKYAVLTREIAAPHSVLAQFKCTYAINKDITGIQLWTDGTFGFKYVNSK